MNIVLSVVLVLQVLSAIGVIVLVLLQHGKGADMGAAFGSGASGSLFGATGSANFLSRTTAVLAALFFICTLALAFLSNRRGVEPRSVMEQSVPAGKPAGGTVIPAPGATPGAPGAASGTSGGAGDSQVPKDVVKPAEAPAGPASKPNDIPK